MYLAILNENHWLPKGTEIVIEKRDNGFISSLDDAKKKAEKRFFSNNEVQILRRLTEKEALSWCKSPKLGLG